MCRPSAGEASASSKTVVAIRLIAGGWGRRSLVTEHGRELWADAEDCG